MSDAIGVRSPRNVAFKLMSDHCAPTDPRKIAANRDGGHRCFFAGLAVIALIRASEALAADQGAGAALGPMRNDFHPPVAVPTASRYGKWDLSPTASPLRDLPPLPVTGTFSSSEFRPRPRSILEPDASATRPGDNLEFDETVWQRLADYRTRDRVRVLTLWESTASAVSIQTDRRGGPSLQWTSRWMNRGGATRGLLDHWLPIPFRGLSRSSSPSPSAKSPNLSQSAPHTGFSPTP